jgi:hypothetical protein
MNEALDATANLHVQAARELDLAARHCEPPAHHFRAGEIPRGTAHAWTARGHLLEAQQLLDDQAREHARRSEV